MPARIHVLVSPWIASGTVHDWSEVTARVKQDDVRVVVIGASSIERLERSSDDEALWSRSGGLALRTSELRAGTLELADAFADLLRNPVCVTTLLETLVDDR